MYISISWNEQSPSQISLRNVKLRNIIFPRLDLKWFRFNKITFSWWFDMTTGFSEWNVKNEDGSWKNVRRGEGRFFFLEKPKVGLTFVITSPSRCRRTFASPQFRFFFYRRSVRPGPIGTKTSPEPLQAQKRKWSRMTSWDRPTYCWGHFLGITWLYLLTYLPTGTTSST